MEDYKVKEKTKTARSYGLILPVDWTETFDIISHVKNIAYRYYYILHDKDFDIETGECKKAHYHVLMTFKYPLQLRTVINYFSDFSHKLKDNSFERIRNIDGAKRYLVHIDNKEKHQYNPDQVETNDLQYKDIFIQKRSIDEELDMLFKVTEDTTSNAEREYLEGIRQYLQTMYSPYQRAMAYLAFKRDFRETFGRTT